MAVKMLKMSFSMAMKKLKALAKKTILGFGFL